MGGLVKSKMKVDNVIVFRFCLRVRNRTAKSLDRDREYERESCSTIPHDSIQTHSALKKLPFDLFIHLS